MFKKPITVLGVNPGSRYLGIAVFKGTDLRDWRIRVIKGKWSKEKSEKYKAAITDIIKQYQPDVMALKKLNPSRSSVKLNKLAAGIEALSRKNKLAVYQYDIAELEFALSPEKKINKKNLAEIIASEYPVLFPELGSEQNHKNPYRIRMFEAVALGSVCFNQLDKKLIAISNSKSCPKIT